MLSGRVAMSIYTLPRFTRDFDFIVHLKPEDVLVLMEEFKEGYYCNGDSVREAVINKGMFNIIDHKSNYKAGFMILKDRKYRLTEFNRRRKTEFLDMRIYIVSPEDLILSKLTWIQDSKSALQMEDIKTLKEIENIDWGYIADWTGKLKINTFGLLKK